jgi:hypothetical protein
MSKVREKVPYDFIFSNNSFLIKEDFLIYLNLSLSIRVYLYKGSICLFIYKFK